MYEARWGEIIEKGETIKPYMDVILQKNKQEYHGFIRDLLNKGPIGFTNQPRGLATPFFCGEEERKTSFHFRLPLSEQTLSSSASIVYGCRQHLEFH